MRRLLQVGLQRERDGLGGGPPSYNFVGLGGGLPSCDFVGLGGGPPSYGFVWFGRDDRDTGWLLSRLLRSTILRVAVADQTLGGNRADAIRSRPRFLQQATDSPETKQIFEPPRLHAVWQG